MVQQTRTVVQGDTVRYTLPTGQRAGEVRRAVVLHVHTRDDLTGVRVPLESGEVDLTVLVQPDDGFRSSRLKASVVRFDPSGAAGTWTWDTDYPEEGV